MTTQNSYLEFTTQMGCRVACLKYCPQELIMAGYKGEPKLSLAAFKKYLSTVPKEMDVYFSGVSEPFQNQETIDMIEWAHENGHAVVIYSTLTGLTPEHAERLIKIPIKKLVLHLPDAYGNARIPNHDRQYQQARAIVEDGIKNIEFMNMGRNFVSNQCEGMARGTTPTHKTGRRTCFFLQKPGYQVRPNGEVTFCCMVRGLSAVVGNLNENTYLELAALHPEISHRMSTDPDSICHRCQIGENYWFWRAMKFKESALGGKTIMQVLSGGT
jgi:hypothetical protein